MCFLISSMISLALTIPLAMMSFMTAMTLVNFIFKSAAISLSLAHTSAERASSHLKLVAMSMILAWTILMISLALTIPLAMMSFMTFMTLANLIFKSAAISLSLAHTSAERASSHLKLVAISMILAWTILMISLALVIPFL